KSQIRSASISSSFSETHEGSALVSMIYPSAWELRIRTRFSEIVVYVERSAVEATGNDRTTRSIPHSLHILRSSLLPARVCPLRKPDLPPVSPSSCYL